jgi:hypothetical protein
MLRSLRPLSEVAKHNARVCVQAFMIRVRIHCHNDSRACSCAMRGVVHFEN